MYVSVWTYNYGYTVLNYIIVANVYYWLQYSSQNNVKQPEEAAYLNNSFKINE